MGGEETTDFNPVEGRQCNQACWRWPGLACFNPADRLFVDFEKFCDFFLRSASVETRIG